MRSLPLPDDLVRVRLDALERVARDLSRHQVASFVMALKDPPRLVTWPAKDPYRFQGTAGVRLAKEENDALSELFTRMLTGLTFAVTGEDLVKHQARTGLIGMFDRLLLSDRRDREGRATTRLEKALGGDIWLGTVGMWNALCAALLAERMEPQLRTDLQAIWLRVMGRELEV